MNKIMKTLYLVYQDEVKEAPVAAEGEKAEDTGSKGAPEGQKSKEADESLPKPKGQPNSMVYQFLPLIMIFVFFLL